MVMTKRRWNQVGIAWAICVCVLLVVEIWLRLHYNCER
jgi:hypothetical protein